jgi:rhodanese-related sulfurtransferase
MSTKLASITRDELRLLIEEGAPFVLVDALSALSYARSRLPGAVNITPEWVEARAPKLIPAADTEIVVYCAGDECDTSTIVGDRLVDLGYRNVRHYVEGKRDWVEAGLPLEGDRA